MSVRRLSEDELVEIRAGVKLFWTRPSRAREYQIENPAWSEAIIAEQWAIVAGRLMEHVDALDRDAADRMGRAIG